MFLLYQPQIKAKAKRQEKVYGLKVFDNPLFLICRDHFKEKQMKLIIKTAAIITLMLGSVFAVTEQEILLMELSAGHGESSADFDQTITRQQVANQTLRTPLPKGIKTGINTRFAYSFESFTSQTQAFDVSGQSHNIKAFMEKGLNEDVIVGGFLNYNAITARVINEGFISNYVLGAFGKYFLPVGVEQNLNVGLGYNFMSLDKAYKTPMGETTGHDISVSISGIHTINQSTIQAGLMYDFFTLGYVSNHKVSGAFQLMYQLNDKLSLGSNFIYTRLIGYIYDDGINPTYSLSTRPTTEFTTIGLLGNYNLTQDIGLNLSLEKTLSINFHNNLVIGIGAEFGF